MGTTGDAPDLALLVDGLQAEREQGITIDVAYRCFSTENVSSSLRTPRDRQYTRNMATGASTFDLAIILIDARYGVQTKLVVILLLQACSVLKNIVVAINKMDLVEFSEARFSEIQVEYDAFVSQLGNRRPENIVFVPISALNGDNVVNPSASTPWYKGQTLMNILESVEIKRDSNKRIPFPCSVCKPSKP